MLFQIWLTLQLPNRHFRCLTRTTVEGRSTLRCRRVKGRRRRENDTGSICIRLRLRPFNSSIR